MRKWKNTEPGIGHLKLGLDKIHESSNNLEEHQRSLDAINLMLKRERKDLRKLQKEFGEAQILFASEEESKRLDKKYHTIERKNGFVKALPNILEGKPMSTAGKMAKLEFLEAKILDKKKKIEKMESDKNIKEQEFERMHQNLHKVLQNQQIELNMFNERVIHQKTQSNSKKATVSNKECHLSSKDNEKYTDDIFTSQENRLKSYFQNNMGQIFFSQLSSNPAKTAEIAARAASIPFANKGGFQSRNVNFAKDYNSWTLRDVSLWLQNMSLGKYVLVSLEMILKHILLRLYYFLTHQRILKRPK